MSSPFSLSTDDAGARVCLLVSAWYPEITGRLRDAALARLRSGGIPQDRIRVLEVPGAFELPQAALWVAQAGDAEAVVALGCIIRGETPHFEYVASACAQGLMQVALTTGVAITFGVITADSVAQAQARSGPSEGKGGNKGTEAAAAALSMLGLFRALEEERRSP